MPDIDTIDGENVKGEEFMEFYPDEDQLRQYVMDHFTQKKIRQLDSKEKAPLGRNSLAALVSHGFWLRWPGICGNIEKIKKVCLERTDAGRSARAKGENHGKIFWNRRIPRRSE